MWRESLNGDLCDCFFGTIHSNMKYIHIQVYRDIAYSFAIAKYSRLIINTLGDPD